jgi:hypothetical protein
METPHAEVIFVRLWICFNAKTVGKTPPNHMLGTFVNIFRVFSLRPCWRGNETTVMKSGTNNFAYIVNRSQFVSEFDMRTWAYRFRPYSFLKPLTGYNICELVVRVPGCRLRGLGCDSRCCHIFWVAVGLERGPLSLCEDKWGTTWKKSSISGV